MKGKCLLQSGAKVQEDLDFNEGLFTLFSANNTYQVGNVVRYQDGLYRCHTAVAAAGAWTGNTNWTKTTVDTLLGAVTVDGLSFLTTAPQAPNTNGKLKIVVLNEEPAQKYAGYLYFVEEEE